MRPQTMTSVGTISLAILVFGVVWIALAIDDLLA
jgi:hypothetical protein